LQFDLFALMTELLKIHQRLRTLSIVKELLALRPQTVFLASKKPPAVTWRIFFPTLSNAQVAEHIRR